MLLEALQVTGDDRLDVRGDDGGRGALVLPELAGDVGGDGDQEVREAAPDEVLKPPLS